MIPKKKYLKMALGRKRKFSKQIEKKLETELVKLAPKLNNYWISSTVEYFD